MAVILPGSDYTSGEGKNSFQQNVKSGLELNLSPQSGGKIMFGRADDYLSDPQTVRRVESRDSQLVPELSSEPPSILDLSPPNLTQTLDTPSIIDSIVDVLPFRFLNGPAPDPVPPRADILSAAAASALLGIDDTERFQDITELVSDPPMPVVSQSPAPLPSPTSSVYSDVTVSSPDTLLSAASTSRDSHFFSPDFEMIDAEADGVKAESSGYVRERRKDIRYAEMRRRNNIASRRSRLTRREKERELEDQHKHLLEENSSLKTRVRNLEEVVEKTKKIIIDVVTKRQ